MDDLPVQPPTQPAPMDPPSLTSADSPPSIQSSPDNTGGSEAPKPQAAPRRSEPRQDSANVKETLESILVAFILAFIFRCFVVEAFVIPTGSMAPTLLGAHSRYQCPDCGYHFDVNYSSPDHNGKAGNDDIDIPDRVQPVLERDPETNKDTAKNVVYDDIHCPNCGLRLPPEENPQVWY